MKSILPLFLFAIQSTLSMFSQWTVYQEVSSFTYLVRLSPDGLFTAKASNNQSLIIEIKNSLQYNFLQELSYPTQIQDIRFTLDNLFMIITRIQKIEVFRLNSNKFEIMQTIQKTGMKSAIMTNDHMNIIVKPSTSYPPTIKNFIFDGSLYIQSQDLNEAIQDIVDIKISNDSKYLFTGGTQQIVRIYERNNAFIYSMINSFAAMTEIREMNIISNLERIMIAGIQLRIQVYQGNPINNYVHIDSVPISSAPINRLIATFDWSYVVSHSINSGTLHIFQINNAGSLSTYQDIVNPNPTPYRSVSMNLYGMDMIYSTQDAISETIYATQCQVSNCLTCSAFTVCQTCRINHTLLNNTCVYDPPVQIPPVQIQSISSLQQENNQEIRKQMCVDNILDQYGNCVVFCDQGCRTCSKSSSNCSECINKYVLANNKCQLQNQQFHVMGLIYSIGSLFRVRKIKSLFFILDDLWPYQFHQETYTKTPAEIFQIVEIVESMRDQILNFQWANFTTKIKGAMISYKQASFTKYMPIRRQDESVLANQIDYFFKSIPVAIALFLLVKGLFLILFNYQISKHLRPLSFNGYLFVMILEGQIEKLSFLGFRNFLFIFSYDFYYKLNNVGTTLVVFGIFLYATCAYFLFRTQYKKLSKYFLDNLKNEDFSAFVMTILFGMRPFMRGALHSLVIEDTFLQLKLLSLTDFTVFLILAWTELQYHLFENKMSFVCLQVYLLAMIAFNFLLQLNLILKDNNKLMAEIDIFIICVLVIRLCCPVLQMFLSLFSTQSNNKVKQKNKQKKQQEQQQEQKSQNRRDNRSNTSKIKSIGQFQQYSKTGELEIENNSNDIKQQDQQNVIQPIFIFADQVDEQIRQKVRKCKFRF